MIAKFVCVAIFAVVTIVAAASVVAPKKDLLVDVPTASAQAAIAPTA